MTDPAAAPAAPPADPPKPRKAWLQFTHPGCRTELRVGALLVLAGTFLWNFAGPSLAMKLALAGLPLLAIGAVLQALKGTQGYPWRLAVAMLLLGLPMCWDFRYRDLPGGPVHLLLIGPILAVSGAWLALWWPLAARNQARARAAEAA